MFRRSSFAVIVLLGGCATNGIQQQSVLIETRSEGRALEGTKCELQTASRTLEIAPPAAVALNPEDGNLTVVCNKPGYRTAELQYRVQGAGRSGMGVQVGGGSGGVGVGLSFPIGRRAIEPYPSQLSIDMTAER